MDVQDGISRFVSDIPPAHYVMKVQSFSLLTKNSIESYESREFESGGYKWKLVLYPSGNRSKNVMDHISLYLALQGTSSFDPCWEIDAKIRFFLLDQNEENYWVVEDELRTEKRFCNGKVEWGYDKLIPLKTFNNSRNGYLVDDTCEFGAEVFVCRERKTGKKESLVMMKDAITNTRTWNIYNYSKLGAAYYDSEPFNVGGHKWKIQFYPKGKDPLSDNYISLYVALVDPTTLHPNSKIYTQITFGIYNQWQYNYLERKANYWFSASSHQHGESKFMLLSAFLSGYYLSGDSCLVRAEVKILGEVDALT